MHIVWPEDNLGKLVLSFHQGGPKDRTQVVRLGSRHPLAIVLVPGFPFLMKEKILTHWVCVRAKQFHGIFIGLCELIWFRLFMT